MPGVPRSPRRRAAARASRVPSHPTIRGARARAAPPLTALPTQKTPYEWAGVFELQKGHKYSWIAQKTGGKYVDDSMELLYKELPATQAVTTENVQALNPADYADPAMKIVLIGVDAGDEARRSTAPRRTPRPRSRRRRAKRWPPAGP